MVDITAIIMVITWLCAGLTGFVFVSQILSTVIACERCFCVVSPLKAQRLVSTRKMAGFLGMTSVIAVGGAWAVVGAKHKVACVTNPLTKVSADIVYLTRLADLCPGRFGCANVVLISSYVSLLYSCFYTIQNKLRTNFENALTF